MGQNVLGGELEPCSFEPLTGFYRDGCCDTGGDDDGVHTVCAVMTAEFLAFSREHGNDLSTPMPAHGFPGLVPGDQLVPLRLPLAGGVRGRRRARGSPRVHARAHARVVLARRPAGPRRESVARESQR